MRLRDYIDFSFTLKDWEIGFGFCLPSQSERFFMGTKLKTYFRLLLFLGPLTIEIGKQNEVAEYEALV